jgi:hypothetical protein
MHEGIEVMARQGKDLFACVRLRAGGEGNEKTGQSKIEVSGNRLSQRSVVPQVAAEFIKAAMPTE